MPNKTQAARGGLNSSNNMDLISAALHTGQLSINSDTIEFPTGVSKRFKGAITEKWLPGHKSSNIDRYIAGDKYKIPISDTDINKRSDVIHVMEMKQAQGEIKKAWERSGREFSPIGLPLDPTFPVSEIEPGKWALQCRSGDIHYIKQERKTMAIKKHAVTVKLVAIECQIRQEASDEVYGVISVHGPANSLIQTIRIPGSKTLNMGEEGARLTFPNVPLVTDVPVEDLYIRVAWIENDSGNEEDVARKVADKLKEAASAAAGALVGAGAESVVASQDEIFYETSLWVVGNVLGMGDDAYPVEGKFISAGELMLGTGPVLQPVYGRNDDNRPVEKWTHDIVVQSVDQGGDKGSYRFFFEVSRIDKIDIGPI